MFRSRIDAANQLAQRLKDHHLWRPIVVGVPRGGVVTAAALAKALGAELNLVFARKLRAPYQPELAMGAVTEDGNVYWEHPDLATPEYFDAEIAFQRAEIKRRRTMVANLLPDLNGTGRSLIVSDDGIATGATMFATLKFLKAQSPREIIVAVPVGPRETIARLREVCDKVICLDTPENFIGVGQFYEDFSQVTDEEMLEILRTFSKSKQRGTYARNTKDISKNCGRDLI